MFVKFLLVDWMACLFSIIIFSIVVINMEKLGVFKLFLLRLTMILIAGSFILCSYTHLTKQRIGATCEDGWSSDSIGSGTCSHHGGVETWKYKYWFDE